MLGSAIACIVVGILLAFLFVGVIHALGLALILVGAVLLILSLVTFNRSRSL